MPPPAVVIKFKHADAHPDGKAEVYEGERGGEQVVRGEFANGNMQHYTGVAGAPVLPPPLARALPADLPPTSRASGPVCWGQGRDSGPCCPEPPC